MESDNGKISLGKQYGKKEARTTIGLKESTKMMLNENRAPGQCYDGFVCQLVELWESKKRSGYI